MNEQQSNEQHWKLLVLILRKIAESKKISQQEIADRAGFKRSNISRMFNLQYCPNLRTFISVAKAIDVNFFFEDKEGKTELNKIFEAAMTELGRRPDNLPQN
jgi:DNA-binding phage protein